MNFMGLTRHGKKRERERERENSGWFFFILNVTKDEKREPSETKGAIITITNSNFLVYWH